MFSRRNPTSSAVAKQEASPAEAPPPDLSAADVDALWRTRVAEVHQLIAAALCKHPREQWMVDVLLDIHWALSEHRRLRPPYPAVPS